LREDNASDKRSKARKVNCELTMPIVSIELRQWAEGKREKRVNYLGCIKVKVSHGGENNWASMG